MARYPSLKIEYNRRRALSSQQVGHPPVLGFSDHRVTRWRMPEVCPNTNPVLPVKPVTNVRKTAPNGFTIGLNSCGQSEISGRTASSPAFARLGDGAEHRLYNCHRSSGLIFLRVLPVPSARKTVASGFTNEGNFFGIKLPSGLAVSTPVFERPKAKSS